MLRGRGFGRRGYSPAVTETGDLEFNVPEELYMKLQEKAASVSMSAEDYVRELIRVIVNRTE